MIKIRKSQNVDPFRDHLLSIIRKLCSRQKQHKERIPKIANRFKSSLLKHQLKKISLKNKFIFSGVALGRF